MHGGALTAGSSRGYCCYGSCYKCSVCGCFFVQSHHNKNICPVISESKEQKSFLSRSTNQVMFSYLQASTLKAMQPTLWKPNRSFCMREQCLPLYRQVKMPFHLGDLWRKCNRSKQRHTAVLELELSGFEYFHSSDDLIWYWGYSSVQHYLYSLCWCL